MVHAEPTQAASGNYSISTVRVREDDNDFSEWPGQIDAQVIMLAEDALDAIRRVLIADETHPYHGVVAGRAADRTELSVGIAAVRLIGASSRCLTNLTAEASRPDIYAK